MKTTLTLASALVSFATGAFAHANLTNREAAVGSSFVAEMRIAHGCNGEAIKSVRIEVPEGFVLAKPQPKAGWDLSVETGPYAAVYDYHGPRSEGVKAIIWSGGDLQNWQFDTFVFRAHLSPEVFEPGQTVYIPTVQTCATGNHSWTEIPIEGQPRPDQPAPALKLIDGGHAHH